LRRPATDRIANRRHHVSNGAGTNAESTTNGDAHMKPTSFAHARALSREFFPAWPRRARARWVLAKLNAPEPKVPISSAWSHDTRAYWFQRTSHL